MITVHDRVRWSDCDPAGILYFGRYIRLYEVAETELMRACGAPYEQRAIEALGAWILRVSFACDFRQPLLLDDAVDVDIWIGAIGRASFEQHFRVRRSDDATVTAEGHCTTVCVDHATRKAMRIPDALRAALALHQHGTMG